MTHIDNLNAINELAVRHDQLRQRLAELRSGRHEAVLVVHGTGGRLEDGGRVHMSAAEGADVVLKVLSGVRADLKRLGVDTPSPPSIVEAST